MKIAIVTAGGAGMFCGSCMQDNTLARALNLVGHDVTLVPTYTPIRVDEEDASGDRVFLGGVNVYLDSAVPGWWRLPRWLTGWLDRPGVLKRLTRRSSATDASKLGWLTVDMLKGDKGPQRREIRRLVDWLTNELRPNVILFSNALLSGIVPSLRKRFDGTIVCLLQGDDIFLDGLPDQWRRPAVDLIRRNSEHYDLLLTHSAWYAEFLSESIGLPLQRFQQIPLTIDSGISTAAGESETAGNGTNVGFFARICPEKGVGNFLDAVERLAPLHPQLQFQISGYLPEIHAEWFHRRLNEVLEVVGGDRLVWRGSPDTRAEKFRILRSLDLLCVPSNYREPKGIFVLEAALAGIPSVVPHHGAFPELTDGLEGCATFDPGSPESLDAALMNCLSNSRPDGSARLAKQIHERHGMESTGRIVADILDAAHKIRNTARNAELSASRSRG